jgi:hypothetical protein
MAKDLKPGEQVVMVNCYEAMMDKYKDKVFAVRSEPWKLGHGEEVVLLEGISGGFSTDCLKRVEG